MSGSSLSIPADNRILFFRRDRAVFGFLSNFYEAPITVDGELWRSTEFFYQAQKSSDADYRDAVRRAETPGRAKELGSDPQLSARNRRRSWFHLHPQAMRADWNDVKLSVMRQALSAKFTQNADLGDLLLATGDAEFVEDSAYDSFWGVGRDGLGTNCLGKLLMKIRDELRLVVGENHGGADFPEVPS